LVCLDHEKSGNPAWCIFESSAASNPIMLFMLQNATENACFHM
jgi:hypothetical protein